MQDNQVDNLPMVELAANNHISMSTEITLFFANYRFHPQIDIEPLETYDNNKKKQKLLAADEIEKKQNKMIKFLQNQLTWAQKKYAQFANQDCQLYSKYQIKDKVYMDAKYFASKKLSKKL